MATTGEILFTQASTTGEGAHIDEAWVSPGNAVGTDDNVYASVTAATFDNGDQTQILRTYNASSALAAAIPSGATIDGVIIRINGYSDSATAVDFDLVQLLDAAGALSGSNLASPSVAMGNDPAVYHVFGSSTEKWGLGAALTRDLLIDAQFGVGIGVLAQAANSQCWIDTTTIEVYYHTGTPQTVTADQPVVHTREFGTAKINHTVFPAATVHTRGIGTAVLPRKGLVAWAQMQVPPEVTGEQTITPTGFTHTRAIGNATLVVGAVVVEPSSVAHSRDVPGPQINQGLGATATVHTRGFGSPTLALGAVTVSPSSATHTRGFGSPTLHQALTTQSVVHTRGFGTASVGGLFPAVTYTAGTQIVDDTASPHTVTLPTNPVAGQRWVACFVLDGNHNITWPGDWVELGQTQSGGAVTMSVAEHIVTGSEGATMQVSFDGGVSEESVCIILRVIDADSSQASEVGFAVGASTNPDPAALNPVGWDVRNTLWIVFAGIDGGVAPSASPANYTTIYTLNSGGATGVGIGYGTRQLAAASEDPGAFTAATEDWIAAVVAVTPQGEPAQQVSPTSVTHTRAIGTPTAVRGTVTLTPGSVIHTRAFGTATLEPKRGLVSWAQFRVPPVEIFVLPTSVVHGRAFGDAKVYSSRITPSSIVHTRAVGTANVIGLQMVFATSVDHGRAIGTTAVGLEPQIAAAGFVFLWGDVEFGKVEPVGVEHVRAFGLTKLHMRIFLTSTTHTRAFGVPLVGAYIAPSSVVHERAIGTLQVNHGITVPSVIHPRIIESPDVGSGVSLIQATSIVHTRAVGNATVAVSVFPQTIFTSSVVRSRNITGPIIINAGIPPSGRPNVAVMEWGIDSFHPDDVKVESGA